MPEMSLAPPSLDYLPPPGRITRNFWPSSPPVNSSELYGMLVTHSGGIGGAQAKSLVLKVGQATSRMATLRIVAFNLEWGAGLSSGAGQQRRHEQGSREHFVNTA